MSKSTVGIDFFITQKTNGAPGSHFEIMSEQRRTLQGVMSRINPQLLKAMMAPRSANGRSDVKAPENDVFRHTGMLSWPENPVPGHDSRDRKLCSSLPIYNPVSRFEENQTETPPLTIFYNGTVTVFNVPPEKAKMVMRFAENGNVVTADPNFIACSGDDERQLLEKLKGDLPIARKKSLQRFLEKRKGRYWFSFYNPRHRRTLEELC